MPITRSLTSIRRSRSPEFPTEEELEQAYNHARLTLCSQGYNLTEGIARELYDPSINDINDINNIQALEVVIISKFLKAIENESKTNMFRKKEDNNNGRSKRDRNYVIRYDSLNKREIILIDNDDNDGNHDYDNVDDNDCNNDDKDDNNIMLPIQRNNTTKFSKISQNESIVVSVLIESHDSEIQWAKFLILNSLIFLGLFLWFFF
ncbi:hypothetical protein RclHR1_00490041 [Rhizophagus clarus]|uniref:Uncharacterized protein n=1 Tax=Rhizophagus clarus TaxID=94130 RepID=A0A2Z6RX22_9GLOM|nr:hypothetical protein RclHR1_00490041 [Rhizophagus clarus]GES80608.1 hypothetical protein GLOIN_2v1780142 [Rhizophagus clarus]